MCWVITTHQHISFHFVLLRFISVSNILSQQSIFIATRGCRLQCRNQIDVILKQCSTIFWNYSKTIPDRCFLFSWLLNPSDLKSINATKPAAAKMCCVAPAATLTQISLNPALFRVLSVNQRDRHKPVTSPTAEAAKPTLPAWVWKLIPGHMRSSSKIAALATSSAPDRGKQSKAPTTNRTLKASLTSAEEVK